MAAQDLHTGCDLLHTSCMFCFCISSARVCFLRIIGWIKFGMSEGCCQAAWHGERWSLSASTRPFYKEDHNGDWQEKDCLELGKCSWLTSSHANQDPKKWKHMNQNYARQNSGWPELWHRPGHETEVCPNPQRGILPKVPKWTKTPQGWTDLFKCVTMIWRLDGCLEQSSYHVISIRVMLDKQI